MAGAAGWAARARRWTRWAAPRAGAAAHGGVMASAPGDPHQISHLPLEPARVGSGAPVRHLALVPQAQGGRPSRLEHLCGGNAGPHGSSRNPQSWPHPQAGGRTGGDVPTKKEGGFPLSAVTCIWLNTSACICCDAPVDGVYTVTVHCCGLEATSWTGYWT
jgi:hypothetical protein